MKALALVFVLSIGFSHTAVANPAGIKKEISTPSWNLSKGKWIFTPNIKSGRIESLKKNLETNIREFDATKCEYAQRMPFLTINSVRETTDR
jgi:hypothetical protein